MTSDIDHDLITETFNAALELTLVQCDRCGDLQADRAGAPCLRCERGAYTAYIDWTAMDAAMRLWRCIPTVSVGQGDLAMTPADGDWHAYRLREVSRNWAGEREAQVEWYVEAETFGEVIGKAAMRNAEQGEQVRLTPMRELGRDE